jgi:hypothetical protein
MKDEKRPIEKKHMTVEIFINSKRVDEIVLRNTGENVLLDQEDYIKYEIIKPDELVNEILFHRRHGSTEALLSILFSALADAGRESHRAAAACQ